MNLIEPKFFRSVMGLFATGVTIVTYEIGNEPAGMTANAFMSVSIDPPLVAISVRRQSRFSKYVGVGQTYGVNFLAEDQKAWSSHFGGKPTGEVAAPFFYHEGMPLIEGSLGNVIAKVVSVHEAGDHFLYIGHVQHLRLGKQQAPLVFHKGKYRRMPANATQDGWQVAGDCW